jgi:3-methyladenine DNA glycosylase Tag
MFSRTLQKREPQRSIAYSESCKAFNEAVSNRQVRRAKAVADIKAQRTAVTGIANLAKRLAKRGITFNAPTTAK